MIKSGVWRRGRNMPKGISRKGEHGICIKGNSKRRIKKIKEEKMREKAKEERRDGKGKGVEKRY